MSLVEEVEDEFAEEVVETADVRREHHQRHEDDDRVVDDLGPSRPGHLTKFRPDFLHELTRRRALVSGFRARLLRARPFAARGSTVFSELPLLLEHALGFSVHRHWL